MGIFTPSYSEFIDVRGLRYHLRRWGDPDAPALFLLHGWMDVSATFQFLVDELQGQWNIIAPDWRGFGLSQWLHQPYWLGDLIADLDAILERLSGTVPATIVAHSMGGNIAGLYAGARPERVARLVTLEGFGHPSRTPSAVPVSYAQMLDGARQCVPDRLYASRAELAQRLMRANPRLSNRRAEFLAQHFGRDTGDGTIARAVDPHHRDVFSHLVHHNADFLACWRSITAPVLWVAARESSILKMLEASDPPGSEYDYAARLASFPRAREVMLEQAGHNMHHDQPKVLAGLVEEFLAAPSGS